MLGEFSTIGQLCVAGCIADQQALTHALLQQLTLTVTRVIERDSVLWRGACGGGGEGWQEEGAVLSVHAETTLSPSLSLSLSGRNRYFGNRTKLWNEGIKLRKKI